MTAALILIGQVYLGLGLALAAVFLTWGIGRVEPQARGSYLFRPLLVPGCVLIWPLVLVASAGVGYAIARRAEVLGIQPWKREK